MKLMDEKGRLFGKVNVFDLLVILAILAVVAAVGLKVMKDRNEAVSAQDTKQWIATVRISAAEPALEEALKKDNRIYYDTGYQNATIENIRSEPAQVTLPDANGNAVRSGDPYFVDIYMDLVVEDLVNDPLIKIGNASIQVGSELYIKTFYAFGKASVVDIREP